MMSAPLDKKARRGLPERYISWTDSLQAAKPDLPDGFSYVVDEAIFGEISLSLLAESFACVLDAIARTFGCQRTEICLIGHGVTSRDGQKFPGIYFRLEYNQFFNEILKTTGRASFNKNVNTWSLPYEDYLLPLVISRMAEVFKIVIDIDSMSIMMNASCPANASKEVPAFYALPFHVPVEINEVIKAIYEFRPNEKIIKSSLCVHDGSQFVPSPSLETIWVKTPFLLFRYAVLHGVPRYASYSTLGATIEDTYFGNTDKSTYKSIARFKNACRILKLDPIEPHEEMVDHELAGDRDQLQGGFDRFAEEMELLTSVIKDLQIIPLCSDYVTLVNNYHGADSMSHGIIAYVPIGQGITGPAAKIASFFGYEEGGYPVIFSREMLDLWYKKNHFEFLITVTHELAHWLVIENEAALFDDDDHGVDWAIYQDLLMFICLDKCFQSVYRGYFPHNTKVIDEIEHVVSRVGAPALESLLQAGQIAKTDLHKVARDCISKVAEVVDESVELC